MRRMRIDGEGVGVMVAREDGRGGSDYGVKMVI